MNQLEILENIMKNNLTSQDKPNAGKPGCGEIVKDYSLPDYLLVSTVLTVDYPVPAIASSIRQEEGIGGNIPEGGRVNNLLGRCVGFLF